MTRPLDSVVVTDPAHGIAQADALALAADRERRAIDTATRILYDLIGFAPHDFSIPTVARALVVELSQQGVLR